MPSLFEQIADATNSALTTILTTEGRKVPDYVVGTIAPPPTSAKRQGPFGEMDPAIRVRWLQNGGGFNLEELKELADVNTQPPVNPMAVRRADAHITIWHVTAEHAEHVLDRLMLATKQLQDPPTAYAQLFHWKLARYEYPSQMIGQPLVNGVHIIRLMVPIDLPVASRPDGTGEAAAVTGNEPRMGLAEDLADDIEDAEYETDRLTTAWPG